MINLNFKKKTVDFQRISNHAVTLAVYVPLDHADESSFALMDLKVAPPIACGMGPACALTPNVLLEYPVSQLDTMLSRTQGVVV